MLGKTHVISSLAVMHVGLLGYTVFKNRDVDVKAMIDQPDEALEVFGFPFGNPLSLVEYSLIVIAVTLFILWLLRIGGGRLRAGYLGVSALCLGALVFIVDSNYAFDLALAMLAFALGTLLPDIDSETSTIGKYITPISRAIPHRTITHSIWPVLLMAGAAWYFESIYLLSLALGYTLHVAEDSFSRQGIRWFYPIPNLRMKNGRSFPLAYETGGFGESLVFFAAIGVHALCAGYVVWSSINIGV